jgi:hypothetical protein
MSGCWKKWVYEAANVMLTKFYGNTIQNKGLWLTWVGDIAPKENYNAFIINV